MRTKKILQTGVLLFVLGWPFLEAVIFPKGGRDKSKGEFYDFSRVERPFGELALGRVKNLTKKSLEFYLIQNVPQSVRKNLSEILGMTLRLSEWYQIDPLWVLSIMWVESHYNHAVKSRPGALGLMQIMPETGEYIGLLKEESLYSLGQGECQDIQETRGMMFPFLRDDLSPIPYRLIRKILSPSMNVEMGIIYLKCLLKKFNNDPQLATMAYNLGPNRARHKMNLHLNFGSKNRYLEKVKEFYLKLSNNFELL